MMSMNRREFLKIATKGLLALSGVIGAGEMVHFLGYSGEESEPKEFDLGPASNYPTGSRTLIEQANALLIHTESGYTAISLTCTHLGCNVKPIPEGFACPCHNSQFDPDGNVRHGPAAKPLERYRVEQTEKGTLVLSKA